VRPTIGAVIAVGAVVTCSVGSLCACEAVSGLNNYASGANDMPVVVEDGAGPVGSDDGGPPDASVAAEDAPTIELDASVQASDAESKPDGFVCNTMTCNGCCDSAGCHGGNSVTTCGSGGATCTDCTSRGGACNNHVCGAHIVDAGPQCTTTNVAACSKCATVLYTACCKKDGTCGCQWTGFAPCQ
jgi:hypothetical protein